MRKNVNVPLYEHVCLCVCECIESKIKKMYIDKYTNQGFSFLGILCTKLYENINVRAVIYTIFTFISVLYFCTKKKYLKDMNTFHNSVLEYINSIIYIDICITVWLSISS